MSYFIKEMPPLERPRERLVKHGAQALSDSELLAIIIETGTKDESVISLSKRILYQIHSLSDLSKITYQELVQIKGIKMAKAAKILAVIELSKRLYKQSLPKLYKIKTPNDVYNFIHLDLAYLEQEHLYAIYLNTQSEIIDYKCVFKGTINEVLVHPRDLFNHAYKVNATAFIICHNHPSGNSKPSMADLKLTEDLLSISELLKIDLVDHIIIGKNEFYSIKRGRKTKV